MQYIHSFLNIILHLNTYLALYVSEYGFFVYIILFLIIFCETGIIVAAILPGDSLLFAAGTIAAAGSLNIYWLLPLLWFAAFSGNTINYWVGNKVGHILFRNEDSKIFRRSYLNRTHIFYEKHGGKTIVLGCFMPIIRTFAPFVAGMSKMNHTRFMLFNFFGVAFWMTLILYGSYLFGNIPFVKAHFSVFIVLIIIASVIPAGIELLRARLRASKEIV